MENDNKWPEVVTLKSGILRLPHGDEDYQFLSVIGEGNTADTLTEIVGGKPGDLLVLQPGEDEVAITIDDTYISCGGSDLALTYATDKAMLICVAEGEWHLLSYSITAGGA